MQGGLDSPLGPPGGSQSAFAGLGAGLGFGGLGRRRILPRLGRTHRAAAAALARHRTANEVRRAVHLHALHQPDRLGETSRLGTDRERGQHDALPWRSASSEPPRAPRSGASRHRIRPSVDRPASGTRSWSVVYRCAGSPKRVLHHLQRLRRQVVRARAPPVAPTPRRERPRPPAPRQSASGRGSPRSRSGTRTRSPSRSIRSKTVSSSIGSTSRPGLLAHLAHERLFERLARARRSRPAPPSARRAAACHAGSAAPARRGRRRPPPRRRARTGSRRGLRLVRPAAAAAGPAGGAAPERPRRAGPDSV